MRTIKKLVFGFSIISLVLGLGLATVAQSREPVPVVKDVAATIEMMALTYREGRTITVKFQGTHRLPRASGEAKIQRKKGATGIEIKLDEMIPAIFFGGDYNTYVLWTVSPEGHAHNVGEFKMRGNGSKLNVSTPLETFGLFITAEPHFLVGTPSRFVVLENTRPKGNTGGLIQTAQVKYRGSEGIYKFDQETLANAGQAKKDVRVDLSQARTAVTLAERAQAAQFAPDELNKAGKALRKAEASATAGASQRNLEVQAHEAERLAAQAHQLAEARARQATLDAERKAQEEEKARAAGRAEQAERLRRDAEARARETKQEAQQLAAAKSEADRATERARLETESARQETERARLETERARQETERGRVEAERARGEREEARHRMRDALTRVVETRETVRGLILNLPDILFDTGQATLRPQAREVLSKVAGILLVARGYRLNVEGHTDSVGSEEFNQRLSDKRVLSVREYLVKPGLSPDLITTKGFGKSQPIADNATATGRQKNRRVEIIIEESKDFKYRQE